VRRRLLQIASWVILRDTFNGEFSRRSGSNTRFDNAARKVVVDDLEARSCDISFSRFFVDPLSRALCASDLVADVGSECDCNQRARAFGLGSILT
jgi:hypothetical protein